MPDPERPALALNRIAVKEELGGMDLHVYPQFRDQSPGPVANQLAVSAFHAPQGRYLLRGAFRFRHRSLSGGFLSHAFPAMASPPVVTPWPPCPLPELPVPACAHLWQRVPKPR